MVFMSKSNIKQQHEKSNQMLKINTKKIESYDGIT